MGRRIRIFWHLMSAQANEKRMEIWPPANPDHLKNSAYKADAKSDNGPSVRAFKLLQNFKLKPGVG